MTAIRRSELPQLALLRKYRDGVAYTDCYVTAIAASVSLLVFVEAFYTTPLFKVERVLLRWFASCPSTDAEARQLAEGTDSVFAAWRVEARTTDQLLLADMSGRTRSWLMVAPDPGAAAGARTQLYFGSAVVPAGNRRAGGGTLGFPFDALIGFHKLYSRLLLRSAHARLSRVIRDHSREY